MSSTPKISFSTLAKLMGPTTPVALRNKLRDHKYPSDGPKRSYQNALRQAVGHIVDGATLDPEAANLRSWEQEAVGALAAMAISPPAGTRPSRPNPNAPDWQIGGVFISMYPDVELTGVNGVGAMKFHFTKERLARGVGTTMAALLWHYRSQVLRVANVNPAYCAVYEPRVGATYVPGRNPAAQVQNATLTCQMIATLWSTV